jgi:hypothetical protein
MLGPVDYIVVGFDGNRFDGSIMDEINKAVDDKIIRVLDLVFIMKDKDGNVTEAEYIDQSDDMRSTFGDFQLEEDLPLISESDVIKIGSDMDNDTAAGVLVVEHIWAKGLKKSIASAGGYLISDGRVHSNNIDLAMSELAAITAR